MEQVTFSEGGETHNELVYLALSTSSSDEISVTLRVFPTTYSGLVSQQVTFTRGATTAVRLCILYLLQSILAIV